MDTPPRPITIVVNSNALGELARFDIKLTRVGLEVLMGIAVTLAAPNEVTERDRRPA